MKSVSSQNRAGGFNCQEQAWPRSWIPRPAPRSLKSFRLPCQVQRVEVSVVHAVDRVLHCTVHTGHPNYNLLGQSQQSTRLFDLPPLLLLKPKKIPRLAFSCYRHLNSRKPHTTHHLCERTTFTKIINKNNEIAINTKEQTVVHYSNRPVALASMNIWVSSKRDFLWNQ